MVERLRKMVLQPVSFRKILNFNHGVFTVPQRSFILSGRQRFKEADRIDITFIEADGNEVKVKAKIGETLLNVAHENKVELEGACGGELACSTCHLIFPDSLYNKLPPKKEEEDDMLDLAWGLTETSRLGCQIKVTEDMDGVTLRIPDGP